MFVTPIQSAKISLPGNNKLYIKREDLLPFSFGGNKVRIAQVFLRDMLNKKKTLMIGYGNSRSNLCRVLSNLCVAYNVPIWIVSPDETSGERVQSFNSYLVSEMQARFIPCSRNTVRETIEETLQAAYKAGFSPYYINGNSRGEGNEAVPVQAYVHVYRQIIQQVKRKPEKIHYIFSATGTGMTQAGLICGKILAGTSSFSPEIVGISIARPQITAKAVIAKYAVAYLRKHSISYNMSKEIHLKEYSCGGYGIYNEEIVHIIQYILKETGVALDPVYTAKAFCGMLHYLKENEITGKNILFIHTGSNPLFFDWLNKTY